MDLSSLPQAVYLLAVRSLTWLKNFLFQPSQDEFYQSLFGDDFPHIVEKNIKWCEDKKSTVSEVCLKMKIGLSKKNRKAKRKRIEEVDMGNFEMSTGPKVEGGVKSSLSLTRIRPATPQLRVLSSRRCPSRIRSHISKELQKLSNITLPITRSIEHGSRQHAGSRSSRKVKKNLTSFKQDSRIDSRERYIPENYPLILQCRRSVRSLKRKESDTLSPELSSKRQCIKPVNRTSGLTGIPKNNKKRVKKVQPAIGRN